MSRVHSKHWRDYHAKWPNTWTQAACRLPLSGLQARVLMYVVSRTWGDYDGRRQRFGRAFARLASADIAEALGGEDPRAVRQAIARLVDLGALRRFRPGAGRRPAAIGPEPLLCSLGASDDDSGNGHHSKVDLSEVLAGLSPAMRAAALAAGENCEA